MTKTSTKTAKKKIAAASNKKNAGATKTICLKIDSRHVVPNLACIVVA